MLKSKTIIRHSNSALTSEGANLQGAYSHFQSIHSARPSSGKFDGGQTGPFYIDVVIQLAEGIC